MFCFFYSIQPLWSHQSLIRFKVLWQPLIAPFRINDCKGTGSFSHERIPAWPENWLEVDLWIQNSSSTAVTLSWYLIIINFSSTKLSSCCWMASGCFQEVFCTKRTLLFGGHKWVCEWQPKLLARFFFFAITASALQKANLPITGHEPQLCCVFNLRGPIWRHHRVMRSDTFLVLIAVAPVARLPEGCSGQEGHKYFLMSINLITVLCKQGLCYGDRWMYLHFPPPKKQKKTKTNWRTFLWPSSFVSLVTEHVLVSVVIFRFSTFWQWNQQGEFGVKVPKVFDRNWKCLFRKTY